MATEKTTTSKSSPKNFMQEQWKDRLAEFGLELTKTLATGFIFALGGMAANKLFSSSEAEYVAYEKEDVNEGNVLDFKVG